MTSPADPNYAQRLKVSAQAVGVENPQLAHLLATSGLSATQIQAVGGFTGALQLNTANQLAADSGVTTNFNAGETGSLAAINVNPVNSPAKATPDTRGWLEKAADAVGSTLADGGNFIFHNPVTHALETGLNWIGNAAHMPFRMVSAAVGGEDTQARDAQMKADGYDPTSTVSKLAFMFNHSDSEYHSLDHARLTYGDDLVDLAVQQQADPEQFQRDWENMAPDQAAALKTKINSQAFKDALAAVDAMHISPGRDLANVVLSPFGVHTENNELFKLISGTADAAYDWFSDPTLILGKATVAVRAADALGRVGEEMTLTQKLITKAAGTDGGLGQFIQKRAGGIQHILDQVGIRKVLGIRDDGTVAPTKIGQAWQRFLDRAAEMRQQAAIINDPNASAEAKAAANALHTQLYTQMDSAHRALMPLLDEINGTRVVAPKTLSFDEDGLLKVEQPESYDKTLTTRGSGGWLATQGKPITDLHDLGDYLVSTGGLLRLAHGEPAQQLMVMPGRVSWWAERMASRKANSAVKWLDYTGKQWAKTMPVDEEAPSLATLDQAMDDVTRQQLGQTQYNLLRTGTADGQGFNYFTRARVRMERANRRISTVLPQVRQFDLTDASSVKDVERFARFYLNKGDARKLAATYASGDLAARRSVVRGMLVQSFHASGMSRSRAGQEFMSRYVGDLDGVDRQLYGLDGTDLVASDRGQIHAALSNAQLSTTVPMPSLKQMNQLALRFLTDGWVTTRGMSAGLGAIQSNRVDAVYGHIKMGWITSAAGGLRNSLDELVGFMGKGMFSQWVRGRQAWTQATREARDQRIEVSREYRDLSKQYGQHGARDQVSLMGGDAAVGMEKAQRDLENAVKAQQWRENLVAKLQARHDKADEHYRYHQDAHFDAVSQQRALLRDEASTPEAIQAARDRVAETEANVDTWSVARGKAKMQMTKLPETRAKLENTIQRRGILDVDEAQAQLADAKSALEHARALENAIHYRIPYMLRRFGDSVNDALFGVTAGKLLRVLGPRWVPNADQVEWIKELQTEEMRAVLRDGVQQVRYGMNYSALNGPQAAMDMHRAGLQARSYNYRPVGWGEVEPDGGQGLDDFAKFLQLHLGDPTEPAHAWVQAYKHTGDLQAARDSVRGYLDDDAMRHFLANAEIVRHLKDGSKVTDAASLAQAKDELADRISANMMHGLFSRQGDGKINEALLDQLAVADQIGVPDASWISHNVPTEERPAMTVGQLWAPHNAAHVPGRFPVGYTPMLTKAYGKVVTDQVDALSRNPLISALYINAREHIQPWEKYLVEEAGWDAESAKAVAQRMSIRHAEAEAYKHIDNPHTASQFSLISRNFVNFERAQEDWLRRWGRAIKDNPSIIRKAQLALHAGEAAGLVEQDPTQPNNLYFVYPGSQLAAGVFNKVMTGMGLGDQVKIPVMAELTSQIMFLSPSLSQPYGLTASPLIALPMKALAATVGQDHQLLMNSLDKAMNGTLGSGRSWYETIMPPTINRIIRGIVQSDPGSQYGQAYANAVTSLGAAGTFDKLDGTDPTALSNAQDAVGAQVRNNMFLNMLFGFFAPAVPGVEYNSAGHNVDGKMGTTPDWSAHVLGYKSLKVEAQKALADLGPTRFRLWWAAVHPNELIWDPTAGVASHSKSGTTNAYLPATLNAAEWYQRNPAFLAKYGGSGGIGAYFTPSYQNVVGYDATGNPVVGPDTSGANSFNDIAYRAQLQDHMRELKPLNEYLPDIIVQRGESEYYRVKDAYDAQIKAASDSGDNYTAGQLEDQWSQEKADIYKRNPLLAQKNASYATNGSEQAVALGRLRALVDDKSKETEQAIGPLRDGVRFLLQAYDDYQTGAAELSGRRGTAATQARAQLLQTYQTETQSVSQQFPDLGDLVRGVFRTP